MDYTKYTYIVTSFYGTFKYDSMDKLLGDLKDILDFDDSIKIEKVRG